MNLYDAFMFPIEAIFLRRMRSAVLKLAHGDVLEVGIGTGASAKYYDYAHIKNLVGLDREYCQELERRLPQNKFTFALGNTEQMPFAADRFDCVVSTLTLCTVDVGKTLHEIERVLKPGGLFIFIEHARPSGALAGRLFDAFNGAWCRFAGGCNINRRTGNVLTQSDFVDIRLRQECKDIFLYGTACKRRHQVSDNHRRDRSPE